MELKNYTEDVVLELYDQVIRKKENVCTCEKCRVDIVALALSRLKARYAGSAPGEVLTRVDIAGRQVRADALVALLEATEQVRQNPHHGA